MSEELCVYMCMCVCVSVCICVCVCVCICVYLCVCMCVHVCVCMYVHVCDRECMCVTESVCMCVCVYCALLHLQFFPPLPFPLPVSSLFVSSLPLTLPLCVSPSFLYPIFCPSSFPCLSVPIPFPAASSALHDVNTCLFGTCNDPSQLVAVLATNWSTCSLTRPCST